jgi:hypothetical protein
LPQWKQSFPLSGEVLPSTNNNKKGNYENGNIASQTYFVFAQNPTLATKSKKLSSLKLFENE